MTSDEVLSQVSDIIRDVLDQPDIGISLTTTADDVEGWDSFNHINIMVAVEAHFHIKINTAEVEELKNVGELVDMVLHKQKVRK